MKRHRWYAAWLSLPLVLFAVAAGAQTIPIEVEAGFRWTDIEGNEDLYRTQINEGDGIILRNLTFFTSDFDGENHGIIDHLRIDATDLGTGPSSSMSIDAGRAEKYRLRLGYRGMDNYSALPAFANPFIGQGVVPGQHTFDRSRTMFDGDLEILSLGKITPFIGYSHGSYEGPGTTTYFLGGDEFRLDSDLEETEREIRLGASFNAGRFYGSVTQGWRTVDSDETLTLTSPGSGNNPSFPILGRDLTASTISRTSETETDAPFTNLYVAGQIGTRSRVVGTFVRMAADADSADHETATGTFLSFPIQRYFNGYSDTITSNASNDTWRGGIRAELASSDRVELTLGYRTEHRELGGTALIDSLFRDSITFGGEFPGDFREILDTESVFERNVDTVEAGVSARVFTPLTLRLSIGSSDYEYLIAPDLTEISVKGSQSGNFQREVNTIDASAVYADDMFMFTAGYRRDDADAPVMRTDFVDRNRYRARFGFTSPLGKFRAAITAEETDQDSEGLEIGYDANSRQYTLDAEVAPWEHFRIRGAYSQVRLDSVISTRRPETFALDVSRHEEDFGAMELGFAAVGDPIAFDASAGRVENVGSIPYTSFRYRARLSYQIIKTTAMGAEWARDEYDEEGPARWAKFQGNRYGLFVRYRP